MVDHGWDLCVGCGADISSKVRERRNLGPDSTAAAPREEVLSVWISLVCKQLLLQRISMEETNIVQGKCARFPEVPQATSAA